MPAQQTFGPLSRVRLFFLLHSTGGLRLSDVPRQLPSDGERLQPRFIEAPGRGFVQILGELAE